MSAILYDHRGRPIASQEQREKAERLLQEFMHKFKSRFDDWFRANGLVRPPIFFDTTKQEWQWRD